MYFLGVYLKVFELNYRKQKRKWCKAIKITKNNIALQHKKEAKFQKKEYCYSIWGKSLNTK